MGVDWKYILKLSPEDLQDSEKEDLFNSITWLEVENENVNKERSIALFKISQELLKYKGEQVETLLHELDELATKQGEEEAHEYQSTSQSKAGISVELENLEQKYLEVKSKHKKQAKMNQKLLKEINEIKNVVSQLELEKRNLEQELQSVKHEDSGSDFSESLRDQHKELVETVHAKNKQISDLLHDIEDTEKDNLVLREKLSTVRDELSVATLEIKDLSENNQNLISQLNETQDNIKKLSTEINLLQEEIEDIGKQKKSAEERFLQISEETSETINNLKKDLANKELEIKKLKKETKNTNTTQTEPNVQKDVQLQITTLKKILSERDFQLLELQTKLQEAVAEMEETTNVIDKINKEKDEEIIRNEELLNQKKELKRQLKHAHERTQKMQEEVEHYEKIAEKKAEEYDILVKKLSDDGHIEVSEILLELKDAKAQNRINEKQVGNLIKSINKLQDSYDIMEKENLYLRERLGYAEDEVINFSSINSRHKQQRKELTKLKRQVLKFEEDNLALRTEIKELNQMISMMHDQIMDLEESSKVPTNETFNKDVQTYQTEDYLDDKSSLSVGELKLTSNQNDESLKDELKKFVEENEALRKGLHEILNEINLKKGSSLQEIKSETLEKLLRALDVKHISGWYHPAMRLQAELHNVEGVNAELREQLRITRLENEQLRNLQLEDYMDKRRPQIFESKKILEQIHEGDINTLDNLSKNIDILLNRTTSDSILCENISMKMLQYNDEFINLENQMSCLYKEYLKEKQLIENAAEKLKSDNDDLKIKVEALETQLKILMENNGIDDKVKKLSKVMGENIILHKKKDFLENEISKTRNNLNEVKKEFLDDYIKYSKKINNWALIDKFLRNKIKIMEQKLTEAVDVKEYHQLKNDFDELTIKYRNNLQACQKQMENNENEIELLEKSKNITEKEIVELKNKLNETLNLLYNQTKSENVDDKIVILSKKLSECEVNEISERQRANHINNLYELVKDQLKKSEDRYKEFEMFNKDILHKNLVYQGQIQELEQKLQNFHELENIDFLKKAFAKTLDEKQDLINKIKDLQDKNIEFESNLKSVVLWTSLKEQELLALQHQIVDLQSESDEKVVISRLSMEVMQSRNLAEEWKNKYENIQAQLEKCHDEWLDCLKTTDDERERFEIKEDQLIKKNRMLEDFLKAKKLQYYGCIPLTSEENFLANLKQSSENKYQTFLMLYEADKIKNRNITEKEHLEVEKRNLIQARKIMEGDKDEIKKVMNWQHQKKYIELELVRFKRQSEFKDVQLSQINERIQVQNEQIAKLEEELFLSCKDFEFKARSRNVSENMSENDPRILSSSSPSPPSSGKKSSVQPVKLTTKILQTEPVIDVQKAETNTIDDLKSELIKLKCELESKDNAIEQLKNKLKESEMSISMCRTQISDKQTQITFYEKHILDLQTKQKEELARSQDEVIVPSIPAESEEIVNLKATVKSLHEMLGKKEDMVLHYQSLLKEDRDNHSLAAARMQEEVKSLKIALAEAKRERRLSQEKSNDISSNIQTNIEEYINQIHTLEENFEELKTKSTTLESQLQASRQESSRWKSLANERLKCMEELRQSLEEQHQNEIVVYKNDCQKWREEVLSLKELITKHKNEILQVQPDLQNILKAKDDKIHELTIMFRQMKEAMRRSTTVLESETAPKMSELEKVKGQLLKEHETLKKRFDQLLQKERNAREEIRDLKGQLMKSRKPANSARSEKSEKSAKEQLQRKITSLEEEVLHLKDELAAQTAINESHRVKITEDFDRWKRQKQSQQTIDKLKNKLKEKDAEIEKIQQTCSGYKGLIERLEREKHGLENRIKALKTTNTINFGVGCGQQQSVLEAITAENNRLIQEVADLKNKLELHQHHAGGLGATMLQEKLEGQERKLAVLELSAKGTTEVRAELERLQTTIINLQKLNLFLEGKNVELKMELEKAQKDLPRYKEQIQHLENYMAVLKEEQSRQQSQQQNIPDVSQTSAAFAAGISGPESKKIAELERTILILRRVVEKLQAENKRLSGGKRPVSERLASADKLKKDHTRLKQQYGETLQQLANSKKALAAAEQQIKFYEASKTGSVESISTLNKEIRELREEVYQKTHLLEKVKILLQKASTKERDLLREIADLKVRLGIGENNSGRPESSK